MGARWSLVLVCALSLVAGLSAYTTLVRGGPEPRWDEAAHALQGALIAHDLRGLDLLSLAVDTYRQVYWPPIHSWLLGVAFLLSGPSMEAARGVSIVCFVLLVPTIFLLARAVEPRNGTLAGLSAAALSLTFPGLIMYAAQTMLELPALLALFLTTLVYVRLERDPTTPPRAYLAVGVLVMVTYLVKSNYGVLFILSLFFAQLIQSGFRARRLLTRRNLFTIIPILVLGAIWFAYPPKIVTAWNALLNQPWGGAEGRGWRGVLFYPRALASLSGSIPMFLLLWGGVMVSWRARRQPGVLLLIALAILQLIIGQLHHTKLDRHIMPMLPAMAVLAGVAVVRGRDWLRARSAERRVATLVVALALAAFHFASLAAREWTRERDPDEALVLRYVSEVVRDSSPTLVIATRDARPRPPTLDWHLATRERLLPITSSGAAMDVATERRLALAIERSSLPRELAAGLRGVLSRYDAPSSVHTLPVGNRTPIDQRELERELTRSLAAGTPRVIVTILSVADTAHYPREFMHPILERAGFRSGEGAALAAGSTRVYLYRRE